MTGFVIIGAGRSGGALCAQALGALGLSLPQDTLPPGEPNLRGGGQSLAVFDRMRRLDQDLGLQNAAIHPDGWLDMRASHDAVVWMADYLKTATDRAAGRDFALCLGDGSAHIALWQRAAVEAAIDLKFIWTWRPTEQAIGAALTEARLSREQVIRAWARSCYYILRDAPEGTLFLPYSDWASAAGDQVAALAEFAGVDDPERRQAAQACYSPVLDGSGLTAPGRWQKGVKQAITALDDLVAGAGAGPFPAQATSDARLDVLVALADVLADGAAINLATHEMRLKRLTTNDGKDQEMQQADTEALRQAIRAAAAENRTLRRQAEASEQAVSQTDDTLALRRAYQDVSQRYDALEKSQDEALQLRAEKLEATVYRQSRQIDKLKINLADTKSKLANTDVALNAQTLKARGAEGALAKIKASTSWKLTRPLRAIMKRLR